MINVTLKIRCTCILLRVVCTFYEKQVPIPLDPLHAIIVGAVETSLKSTAAAIIVTTTTGRSAVLLSMYRPRCLILAVTRHGVVARWLQLYYGIHSLHYTSKYIFHSFKNKYAPLCFTNTFFARLYSNQADKVELKYSRKPIYNIILHYMTGITLTVKSILL